MAFRHRMFRVIPLLIAAVFGWVALSPAADSPEASGHTVSESSPGLPGGTVPTAVPALLAPGMVNTGVNTRDVTMTPDGRQLYFCMAAPGYRYAVILVTQFADGAWTEPETAPFSGSPDWLDLEPFISPDGQRFFFMSTRPEAGEEKGEADIWVMDRQGDRWSEPRNLDGPVNTDQAEFFPAVTRDGTLYFTRADSTGRIHRIFRARPDGDGFQVPELLPDQVNCGVNRFNATISPDETLLIVPAAGMPGSHGQVDYFLVRRNEDDTWNEPVNLGPVINDGSPQSWSPYLTPDGGTFMFMSARRHIPEPAWPAAWGDLQTAHLIAGGGNPNINLVRADFLDDLPAAVDVPAPAAVSGPRPEPVPFPELAGPYLGQEPPGLEPVVFAPGIVSTGMNERDLLVSGDGGTIWYGFMGQGLVTIMETRLTGGRWTEPAPVPFHRDGEFFCFEPTLAADGQRVLFLSNRAAPGQEQGQGWANQNIFSSRLVNGVWEEPEALAAPITTSAAEYFPSLAADGTLYFTREDDQGQAALWAAEPLGNGFGEPRRLPATVNVGQANYNGTVAPDESWLLFCVNGHPENLGNSDYWISFREEKGSWGPAVNPGDPFNGPGLRAASGSLSPDGKYLFFSTNKTENNTKDKIKRENFLKLHKDNTNGSTDIWWVDVDVLDKFR
ncbi:MAG: hypothetical protein ABFS42_02300 [Candidatus Krumholzibacteriota bacterium]